MQLELGRSSARKMLHGMAMTLQGESHKCSQADAGKYQLIICFPHV